MVSASCDLPGDTARKQGLGAPYSRDHKSLSLLFPEPWEGIILSNFFKTLVSINLIPFHVLQEVSYVLLRV
jgi:hypothetical protein